MPSSTKHIYLSILKHILYQIIIVITLIAEDRQRGRFAGFSLYVSNSGVIQGSTLCYKDGHRLPPLNFTIACTESGRYVIFYNERLDGVTYPSGYELENVYTELCEVIVQGKYVEVVTRNDNPH